MTLTLYAPSIIGATALLAACGGSQPPIGAPGSLPQSHAISQRAERGGSWMLPEAKGEALLYVTNAYYSTGVSIYRLGSAKLVGQLGIYEPAGVCSDSSGNVYVVDQGAEQIFEFAHGGRTPIKTLSDPYANPITCSFDKTTGNLEVTDGSSGVLIYAGASGTPTRYYNYRFEGGYNFAAYDDRGDLLVDGLGQGGPQFAELAKGGRTLSSVTLNANIASAQGMAWDGKYFAICDQGQHPNVIDAISLSGSNGTLRRMVTLDSSVTLLGLVISPFGYAKTRFSGRKEIIAADINSDARKGHVWYWGYPKGGTPIKMVTERVREPVAVAVSKAPQE